MTTLRAGQKAPDFRAATDEGGEIGLRDLKGKYVAIFFFPKALTPG